MKTANIMKTGVIFNIQKFSVNDGPGIRTVVFFKGCPLRCHWCSNPESQLSKIQILWNKEKCVECHHCIDICSSGAISLHQNHIHFNTDLCINCGHCILECPEKALKAEGEIKTVQEIMNVVLQDRVFYEESGGGITLSGGEILSQPDFAEELILAAKEESIHTCCETTGFAQQEFFIQVIAYIDYILFDMKHWDANKHKKGTGVSNDLIISNMMCAVKMKKTVLPRIPVIPEFNDSLDDATNFSKMLHKIGIQTCQILPFHQLGENKYHLLDKPYTYADIPSLHREDLSDYLKVLQTNGIDAFF